MPLLLKLPPVGSHPPSLTHDGHNGGLLVRLDDDVARLALHFLEECRYPSRNVRVSLSRTSSIRRDFPVPASSKSSGAAPGPLACLQSWCVGALSGGREHNGSTSSSKTDASSDALRHWEDL